MATMDHTPKGRGYDTRCDRLYTILLAYSRVCVCLMPPDSFGYFHHDNSYFNEKIPDCGKWVPAGTPFNTTNCYGSIVDLWDTSGKWQEYWCHRPLTLRAIACCADHACRSGVRSELKL